MTCSTGITFTTSDSEDLIPQSIRSNYVLIPLSWPCWLLFFGNQAWLAGKSTIYIYKHIHTYIYIYIHMSVCIYIWYIYIYMCVYYRGELPIEMPFSCRDFPMNGAGDDSQDDRSGHRHLPPELLPPPGRRLWARLSADPQDSGGDGQEGGGNRNQGDGWWKDPVQPYDMMAIWGVKNIDL